jgi:uncharacterized repeat protein (TIGR03803 family)
MIFNPVDNNFYGTDIRNKDDMGVIIQLNPVGKTKILASFDGLHGRAPRGDIVARDAGGKLYGSAGSGGEFDKGCVYSVNTNGEFQTLFSFNGADGLWPLSGLVSGPEGIFYGTTAVGGKYGKGTIFQISSTGDYKELASFNYGSRPRAWRILFGADGNIYGTTQEGTNDSSFGTIFRLTPNGDLRKLFIFNGINGSYPRDLIQGPDGNLYGITQFGGAGFNGSWNSGSGTVFRVVLHAGKNP